MIWHVVSRDEDRPVQSRNTACSRDATNQVTNFSSQSCDVRIVRGAEWGIY